MAQKTVVVLVDDKTGEELKEGKGETVTFDLDGVTYETDLSTKNADEFRGLFQDYIVNARKVSGGRRATQSRAPKSNAAEVRAWAKSNGIDVPDRGRVPQSVYDQYSTKR